MDLKVNFIKLTAKDAARYLLDGTENVYFSNRDGNIFQLKDFKTFTEVVSNGLFLYRQQMSLDD